VGASPVMNRFSVSGEKGRLAFEKMDKHHSEQREVFCQEADVEITIF
jgi:hypothetical protein